MNPFGPVPDFHSSNRASAREFVILWSKGEWNQLAEQLPARKDVGGRNDVLEPVLLRVETNYAVVGMEVSRNVLDEDGLAGPFVFHQARDIAGTTGSSIADSALMAPNASLIFDSCRIAPTSFRTTTLTRVPPQDNSCCAKD